MGFLKAVTFITLWILLSFFWVSLGQGQAKNCPAYGQMESWLNANPLLKSWFHFFVDRQNCEIDEEAFFKALAASEPLSIKLNQAKVTFEQFYVPLYHLLAIVDWNEVSREEAQTVQSDLSLIDHSLRKALGKMNLADQDYFRAVVLLDLPSEFVEEATSQEALGFGLLSRRLNLETDFQRSQIDTQDVISPPYQRVFAIDK